MAKTVYNFLVTQLSFQKLIFRLYTEKSFREEFAVAPGEAILKYDLSEKERGAALNLPEKLVSSFAKSLAGKKNGLVRKILLLSPRVVVFSSAYLNGPAFFFNKFEKNKLDEKEVVNLGWGEFDIVMRLPYLTEISTKNLLAAYIASPKSGIMNFLRICFLISKHGLWNRKIKLL